MDQNVSTGSLKTKIVLRHGVSHLSLPFYGMKAELPPASKILGSDDLLARFDLSGAFQRFCGPKKPKEDLPSFLTNIYGTSNLGMKDDQSCSLMRLVERPPIVGKEIVGLSSSALAGFKLSAGPVPENCRFFDPLPGDAALLNPDSVDANRTTNSEVVSESTKHRKRLKRSLEEDVQYPEPEKKAKKHRSGEEKEKKRKKKKLKKNKKNEEESRKVRDVPFY
ncbi:Mediator of RNA polymerase II transcription subunit 19 [Aphelenchoides besseyi]|nr:Mediator of RNA polymerase II transcription subunit 19 [Aphelenchoides besseyi]